MTLTNYWWLLIWIFAGGAFLYMAFPRQKKLVYGEIEEHWHILPAVLLVAPYVVWAGFRADHFGDTGSYRNSFLEAPESIFALSSYLENETKDKGFAVFEVFVKSVIGNSDELFFFIVAGIQLGAIVYVCRKYSCNYWLSIFLFIASTDYIGWVHNGMRQFLSITIIFAAIDYLIQKKYWKLVLVILLASTLHASSLFMIPVIFIVQGKAWNRKSILSIIACIAVLFYAEQFTDLLDDMLESTQYSNMVTDWEMWEDDGTNPIRVFIYSIPMLLSIIGRKQIKAANDPLVNIGVNMAIFSTGLALISMVTSGIFMGRMVETTYIYALLLLLPWELKNIFTKDSSALITGFAIVGYVAFFYYQMHFAWGLL